MLYLRDERFSSTFSRAIYFNTKTHLMSIILLPARFPYHFIQNMMDSANWELISFELIKFLAKGLLAPKTEVGPRTTWGRTT